MANITAATRFIVAPDSFKGGLDSTHASTIIAEAIHATCPDCSTRTYPMADGGEGTAAILTQQLGGNWVEHTVRGPLPQQHVSAGLGWIASTQTAIIDVAAASGLPLVANELRNPMITSSHGTGELIHAAIKLGAQHILLGVGGSATMDFGTGLLSALGWQFLDKKQQPIVEGAQGLCQLDSIRPPATTLPKLTLLCDVTNPLLDPKGAARVFAKQKGANARTIESIEQGYQHLQHWWLQHRHIDIGQIAYGGASGGIALACHLLLKSELQPGADYIAHYYGLEHAIANADVVISAEGKLDSQSLDGKVVSTICKLCQKHNKPLWVFAGDVELAQLQAQSAGIQHSIAINNNTLSTQENIQQTHTNLRNAVKTWVQKLT